jgi:hypothetical protein
LTRNRRARLWIAAAQNERGSPFRAHQFPDLIDEIQEDDIEAIPSMRRWFLSYTSQDFALTQDLKAALQRKDPEANIFFAPEGMRAGGFWKPQLANEIEESTAFILLRSSVLVEYGKL